MGNLWGGGYGIHWPEIDEDLNTEGLLRGAPAPNPKLKRTIKPKQPIERQGTRTKRS